MICVFFDGKKLMPMCFCDCCHGHVKAEGGVAVVLDPGNSKPFANLPFFSHRECLAAFEKKTPAPKGSKWQKFPLERFLASLVENTKSAVISIGGVTQGH